MPTTPLKDILHGEQNAVSVSKRTAPTDQELLRRLRTDHVSSREMVDNSGLMTARVIETPPGKVPPPFSWSSVATETNTDAMVVVVKAHLIESTVCPGYDEEIETLDKSKVPQNFLKMLQYEFVGIQSDLPVPTEGDDIWVDFENRRTLTGPRYHGVKNSVSSEGGVNPTTTAEAQAAYDKNKAIQGRATGVAALGGDIGRGVIVPPSLSAQLAEVKPGSTIPVSPITSEESNRASLGSIRQSSPFSSMSELADMKNGTAKEPHYLRILTVGGIQQPHGGTDIGVPYGAMIYAVADGTVVGLSEIAQNKDNKGIIIEIAFDNPNSQVPPLAGARYVHMSQTYVANGAKVKAGQLIGRSGTAGNSTSGGPHLHFETYEVYDQNSKDRFQKNRVATEREMKAAVNATNIFTSVEQKAGKFIAELAEKVKAYKESEAKVGITETPDEFATGGIRALSANSASEQQILNLKNLLDQAMILVQQIETKYGYGLYDETSSEDRAYVKRRLELIIDLHKSKKKQLAEARKTSTT
jgi:murein DD-endopeptidase MepM/ murein hydrolase activator NlpD